MSKKDDGVALFSGIIAFLFLVYWIVIVAILVVTAICIYQFALIAFPYTRSKGIALAKWLKTYSSEVSIPAIDHQSKKIGVKTHQLAMRFTSSVNNITLAFVDEDVSTGRSLIAAAVLFLLVAAVILLAIVALEIN